MTAPTAKRALAALAALALLVLGIWWGGHPNDLPGFLRDAFVANPHDAVISDALSDIQQDWYRPVGRGGLVDGAIAGAVASLDDPYAQYDTPRAYDSFNNPSTNRFAGIGVEIVPVHAGLAVEEVVPGAPAARAGLEPGDVITSVGGRSLAGLPSARSTALIKGRVGSKITLGVQRGSRRLTFTLTRALINPAPPGVAAVLASYHGVKLGVIELQTFDIRGIHGYVAQDLELLMHQGARGIVLDLRGDGGGLVTEAQLVVSMFLAHGVIVTERGRSTPPTTVSATGDPIAPRIPLVVLVNRGTASAAEITTAALQQHHRAIVVGTRTYGKGVFQEILPLSNGGAITITVGHYYLPNGTNLGSGGLKRGPGIKPNVTVAAGAAGASTDPQLQAALRTLAAEVH